MVDERTATKPMTDDWRARREMAERWLRMLAEMGRVRANGACYSVLELIRFHAIGRHSADLPEVVQIENECVQLRFLPDRVNVLLAMTHIHDSTAFISQRFSYQLVVARWSWQMVDIHRHRACKS